MENILQDIKSAIQRSGFPLEYYIGSVLKLHGWQIITNRNYIDDIKGIEREIDILAYKIYADKEENIEYVTSLIISCKKSDKHKWCFLTRDIDKDDCNTNWTPFHYCTSDYRLGYMSEVHLETIIDRYKAHDAVKKLYSFDDLVFAYQQLIEPANEKERKQNGNLCCVKNEDIYNSISTTIKAINNEKESRLKAYDYKDKQRYYTFHAISVFEGDMFNAHFDSSSSIELNKIYDIKYLNRHIVGKEDDFYIVHFINRDVFDSCLCLYDSIHDENIEVLPRLITSFYEDIFQDGKRAFLLWNEFVDKIKWNVESNLSNGGMIHISYNYNISEDEPVLEICITSLSTEEEINTLNSNVDLINNTSLCLERIFRYTGKFVFCES